jgi:hypothetical protein
MQPQEVTGQLQAFLDAIPPKFPGGCRLVIMPADPRVLAPLGEIPIPEGAILFYCPAEVALHVRPMLIAQLEQARKAMARAMGNGS